MTISTTTTARVQYNGNGSTTAFSVPFVFSTSADLKVYKTVVSTGVETLQTITTHYTVSGGGGTSSPATGTVTFLSAPASGERVTILRAVANLQGVDYVENDAFPAQSHELALDKLTLQLQDVKESLSRAVIFTPGSTTTNVSIGSPVAHALLKWDATAAIITSGFILPTGNGISGQVLGTDGSGNLSWVDPSGTTPSYSLDNLTDVVITSPSNGQVLNYNGTSWVNDTLAGGATLSVTQASHGFTVGQLVRHNGTQYVLSRANTLANSEVAGIVSLVQDVNTFTLLTAGEVTGLSGLTAGQIYFLSAATDGAITVDEPATAGTVSKPVLIATGTTKGIFYNMRGSEIGANPRMAGKGDMELGVSTHAVVTPGMMKYHRAMPKAWGVAGTGGKFTNGYNISSVGDTGTGVVTFNYIQPFINTEYCVIATASASSARIVTSDTRTVSSTVVRIFSDAGAAADPTSSTHIVVYGDID